VAERVINVTSPASRNADKNPDPELPDQGGGFLGEVNANRSPQLAGVATANGGEIGTDFLFVQTIAVVLDEQSLGREVDTQVDAWAITAFCTFNLPTGTGVMGILNQFAAHLPSWRHKDARPELSIGRVNAA
jgi:hypothetical protein